ncbi:MAG: ATP synthase F1 subunit gamma [Crocinitomicaceae bacterium]|nr:ATP synthase F1 subunit gamma [Crocinitomicaceae bacterium]
MANLKEIRNRIASVDSTMQITSAMKMVSAAKLKRAQDAVTQMRPYSNKLQEILSSLSSSLDMSENKYASDREVKNVLLLAVTSNRGLCGGFNNNVIKEVLRMAKEDYAKQNVSVLSVGKKANDAFKRTEYNIKGRNLPGNLQELWNDLTFDNVAPEAEKIMQAYVDGHIDKVVIVYNHFKNVATQVVVAEQFLPILPPETEEGKKVNLDYIFEPSKIEIVEELIPKSLKTQLYSAMLDSMAGEHGARMTAMHKATDNASELNKQLKLDYNKARQAAITNEILEIVGGAEALNG